MTNILPRDPLGLRHSRPSSLDPRSSGFDYVTHFNCLSRLHSLIILIIIRITLNSQRDSAQDDSEGNIARAWRLFVTRGE